MMSTEQLNTCARAAREAIDAYLDGRELPHQILGALFLSVETRVKRDLQPAITEKHLEILNRWAK